MTGLCRSQPRVCRCIVVGTAFHCHDRSRTRPATLAVSRCPERVFVTGASERLSGTRVGPATAHEGDCINPIDPRTVRNELLHHFWTEFARHPREKFGLAPSH